MQPHLTAEPPSRLPPPPDAPQDVSFLQALNVLLRTRRYIGLLGLLGFALGVVLAVLPGRSYTTAASFTPQSRQGASGAAGLAAQFGIAVPVGEAGQSPEFYAALLTSREILGETVDTTYTVQRDSGQVTGDLVALFDPREDDARRRRELTMDILRRSVRTEIGGRTGLVSLRVTAESPTLARDIAQVMIGLVHRFNLERRRTQAGEERRFAEARLGEARAELRVAEERLRSFLQSNRVVNQSPTLQFEADALRREFELRQQLYTTLLQSTEQARLEEVRDTPVITIVEHPYLPARPDPRGLVRNALLGAFLGAGLGMLLAFLGEGARRARRLDTPAYREFGELRGEMALDLRRPWRLLGFGGRRR